MSSEKEKIQSSWTLKGRNFVVTGGSNGIGLATVKGLLANGASGILFCSRSPCETLVASLKEDYPNVKILHAIVDVSKSEGRSDLVNAAKIGFDSKIHGLVSFYAFKCIG